MRKRTRFSGAVLFVFLWVFLSSSGGSPKPMAYQPALGFKKQSKGKVVYVCACLKTQSCSCMTEAKMEGPCACGTQGGPPMKPVPPDSNWAKENRDALAH